MSHRELKRLTFSQKLNAVQRASGQVPFNSNRNISYFVGLDAVATNPRSILIGMRAITNLTRMKISEAKIVEFGKDIRRGKPGFAGFDSTASYEGKGYIVPNDGSVHKVNDAELRQLFKDSGVNNKWGLPD